MRIKEHPFRVQRLLPRDQKLLLSSCLERSCWWALARCMAVRHGTRWLQVGRQFSPRSLLCRFWLATSSHWHRRMFGGSSHTPLSPTLAIRCLDLSPEDGTDFRRRSSTRLFTRSRSLVRLESSQSCAAKLVATMLRIFPDLPRGRRC